MPNMHYTKNSAGRYDCPADLCDKHGEQAYTTTQGLAAHVESKHPTFWKECVKAHFIPGRHAAADAPASPPEPADVPAAKRRIAPGENPFAFLKAGGTLVSTDAPIAPPATPAPRMTATRATTAILALQEIAHLTSAQLEQVMKHVCALKAIDEGDSERTLFESTGFRDPRPSLMRAANGPAMQLAEQG